MKRKTSVPAGRLLKQWRQDQAFLKEYRALDGEFAMAAAMLSARSHARLTQRQLAARMGTTQAVIARWEGGRVMPSTRTLNKLARATGTRLRISFSPARRIGVG
jgi:ribosome-binding protein aMBF1 (putative translation factor)